MVKIFFYLASIITVLFALLILVLFICHWIIYFQTENSVYKVKIRESKLDFNQRKRKNAHD